MFRDSIEGADIRRAVDAGCREIAAENAVLGLSRISWGRPGFSYMENGRNGIVIKVREYKWKTCDFRRG